MPASSLSLPLALPSLLILFSQTVVRKIERQYADVSGAEGDPLRAANEMAVDNYLRNFQWDYSRYRFQGRQLPDLVSQVQTMVAKVDDELKKLSITYNEKLQHLSIVQRKKATNLVTSDLEDFLPADIGAKYEFINSEFLLTVLVVVSSNIEQGLFAPLLTFPSLLTIDRIFENL